MIPSVLASEIQTSVMEFLATEFQSSNPQFQGLWDRFFTHPENLFKGPYLSIFLPFRPSPRVQDFFPDVPMKFKPHLHQELAFNRLQSPNYQSTLIATGTGSGKTECYLMPILAHCYEKRSTRGIKAILIYPMNALATDQAKRLASLIWHNPNLKGKVTAGLFIGESERQSKTLMGKDYIITDKGLLRDNPPDILLTNYKMLDYLLLRPLNQKLWAKNNPETLRYLVVDEIHTFDGAQGTDLACLIRRLKSRLQIPPSHLACVGTSATLGGKGVRDKMLNFAQKIFGESFDDQALIQEDRLTASEFLADAFIDPQPIPSPQDLHLLKSSSYQDFDSYIQAQIKLWFNTSDLTRDVLGDHLKSLPIIHNLLKIVAPYQAIAISEIWTKLREKMRLSESDHREYSQALLDSLIALCSFARNPDFTNLPWLNLRVQLWLRELTRMVGSVEPQPQLLHSQDLTVSHELQTLPILPCWDCGATGWGGLRKQSMSSKIACELKDFYQGFFSHNPLLTMVFPDFDSSLKTGWLKWKLCQSCLTLNSTKVEQCIDCGHDHFILVNELGENERIIVDNNQRKFNRNCPCCQSKGGLVILGSRSASLSSTAIGSLFTSPFNQDRQLLTFSNSVQDAAHRAGFFEARTYRFTFRIALTQFLPKNWV